MSADQKSGVGGCLFGGLVIWLGFLAVVGGVTYVGVSIHDFLRPEVAERRRADERAEKAAEAAATEARIVARETARAEERRAIGAKREEDRLEMEANAEAQRQATTAALERFAECQVRYRSTNCPEDWRPTPEAKAMVEMMRTG